MNRSHLDVTHASHGSEDSLTLYSTVLWISFSDEREGEGVDAFWVYSSSFLLVPLLIHVLHSFVVHHLCPPQCMEYDVWNVTCHMVATKPISGGFHGDKETLQRAQTAPGETIYSVHG